MDSEYVVLKNAVYGDGTKATYTYDYQFQGAKPLLKSTDDPRYSEAAVRIRYSYNPAGALGEAYQEINDVSGAVMATRTNEVVDGQGGTVTMTYSNGRVETYVMPASGGGNETSHTDALGNVTQYTYSDGGTGFLTSETDPLGRTTSYVRSTYGSLIQKTYPDGSVESWTRNSFNSVLSHTDTLGRTTTDTRDSQNRIVRTDYPDASFETFTYNPFS